LVDICCLIAVVLLVLWLLAFFQFALVGVFQGGVVWVLIIVGVICLIIWSAGRHRYHYKSSWGSYGNRYNEPICIV